MICFQVDFFGGLIIDYPRLAMAKDEYIILESISFVNIRQIISIFVIFLRILGGQKIYKSIDLS